MNNTDKYIKEIRHRDLLRVTDDWLDMYKAYYQFDNRVVEVSKFKNRRLHMEKIDGISLRTLDFSNLSDKEKRFIYSEAIDIWCNHLKFQHKNLAHNEVFVHTDYHLDNLFYTGDAVRLLDPEGFVIVDLGSREFYAGKFFETVKLHNHLWRQSQ